MRLLFALLLPVAAAHAQNAAINYVRVLPVAPTPATPVKVVTSVTASSGVTWVDTSWSRQADTLYVTTCYTCGPAQILTTLTDTVQVGLLPPGQFTVKFLAKASFLRGCTSAYTTTNKQTKGFQVSGLLAARPATTAGWAVYPVPTPGRQLLLQAPAPVRAARLLDVAGRECYACPAAQLAQASIPLQLPALPPGTYVLQASLADGTQRSQRVLLE